MLSAGPIGSTYIGQYYSTGVSTTLPDLPVQQVVTPYRGSAPLVKAVIPTYRFNSSTWDDEAPWDTAETWDGNESIQLEPGRKVTVKILS